jgi:hypothetical protein
MGISSPQPEAETLVCDECGGSGKIVEEARLHGANQHSACQRDCDECDGTGRINPLWPDGEFRLHDPNPADDHGEIYLVLPGGLMVSTSGDCTPGVDVARTEWMARALNAALAHLRRGGRMTMKAETSAAGYAGRQAEVNPSSPEPVK